MSPLSFRARLALTMAALILLIAVATGFYLPRALANETIALVGQKADTVAALTAFTIHPALYFGDRAALEEALSGALGDPDVAYVVVAAADGRVLLAHRGELASRGALARRTAGGALARDRSLYEVMAPVRDGERLLANLYIGLSLARMEKDVARMRAAIAILAAVILAAALPLALLLSGRLTTPLRDVAAGARRIASGDLDHRVPARRDDEIGQLALSFNDMADKVAARDAALRRSNEQLLHLTRRLLGVQEEERLRIARAVHDELGQALTAMKIDLQRIGRERPDLQPPLADLAASIDETVDLVRRIASDLRPAILDDLGIAAALEQQLRRLRESAGIMTTFSVEQEPQLDMLTSATLYRIAQEALSNVVRHSGASDVEVSLSGAGDAAILKIRDNGEGITTEQISNPRSLGLLGIRERAELLGGSVAIDGAPGRGTTVEVSLPLRKESNRASSVR